MTGRTGGISLLSETHKAGVLPANHREADLLRDCSSQKAFSARGAVVTTPVSRAYAVLKKHIAQTLQAARLVDTYHHGLVPARVILRIFARILDGQVRVVSELRRIVWENEVLGLGHLRRPSFFWRRNQTC